MRQFPLHGRNEKIAQERKHGAKYSELATRFGISSSRARQICDQQERTERLRLSGDLFLSTRAVSILSQIMWNAGLDGERQNNKMISDFRSLFNQKRLNVKRGLLAMDERGIRNCGKQSTEELLKAAGLINRCPYCGSITGIQ